MAKKRETIFEKEQQEDLQQALADYAKLSQFLSLTPEERAQTPVPEINWTTLVECADHILANFKNPIKMYPEVDRFLEVPDDDPQKLLFVLEKKAAHCGAQPLLIQVRSICNYLGFLIYLGRKISYDEERFSGIECALTLHELSFLAQGIYRSLFSCSLPQKIIDVIDGLPQMVLRDLVNIISQVAETGNLVAIVGSPNQGEPIESPHPASPIKKKTTKKLEKNLAQKKQKRRLKTKEE